MYACVCVYVYTHYIYTHIVCDLYIRYKVPEHNVYIYCVVKTVLVVKTVVKTYIRYKVPEHNVYIYMCILVLLLL